MPLAKKLHYIMFIFIEKLVPFCNYIYILLFVNCNGLVIGPNLNQTDIQAKVRLRHVG